MVYGGAVAEKMPRWVHVSHRSLERVGWIGSISNLVFGIGAKKTKCSARVATPSPIHPP